VHDGQHLNENVVVIGSVRGQLQPAVRQEVGWEAHRGRRPASRRGERQRRRAPDVERGPGDAWDRQRDHRAVAAAEQVHRTVDDAVDEGASAVRRHLVAERAVKVGWVPAGTPLQGVDVKPA
jgi:hypothetical protein